MFAPFLICLREGIQIFLLIIPPVIYFNRNKLYGMSKSAFLGGALGTFFVAIIGLIMFSEAALLNGPTGNFFDGILGIVLAGLVLYSVVFLRKNKAFSTTPNEQFITLSQKGVFIISTIIFFRELLEATLFILASSSDSPLLLVASSLLGLVCAAMLVYLVSKGISTLNISVVFYILNLLLIGLGAYYLGDGLDVLFGRYVPKIFTIGILVYAIPSYSKIIKDDLKKYLNSNQRM